MKICLLGAAGGHLTQLLQLEDLWNKYDYFYITEKTEITNDLQRKHKTYFITDPLRNPIYLFMNFIQSLIILLKEKPKIIITTGGGIGLPICYLGKIFNKKIVFIESLSRVENPSVTGRLVYLISDLFLVQWKYLQKKYGKKAKFGGRVI